MNDPNLHQRSLLIPPLKGGPLKRALFRALVSPLERLIRLREVDRIYRDLPFTEDLDVFLDACMRGFGFNYSISPEHLARIPQSGPLIVVCNHPFGGLEGVILAHLLRRVRPDVKILANRLLARVNELREVFIFVDPFGTRASTGINIGPLKESLGWLKKGGALGIFPAGEVASLRPSQGRVAEPVWSSSVVRLALKSGAAVLPLYFEGANGALFHCAGLLHPRLRTLLLPRELVNKRGKTVRVKVGNPVSSERLKRLGGAEAASAHLRLRTLILGERGKGGVKLLPLRPSGVSQSLASPVSPGMLAEEVLKLPASSRLLVSSGFEVILATAPEIPLCLREIGRLRETTFRKVGEGTGKACDLDHFDEHYLHLFLWDTAECRIAGAYRLGRTDEILARYGEKGLYTHTLFKFKPGFLDKISPALELGRSFVAPEYQKSYAALLLLLRGVATYVAANPKYHRLFGPVSISSDYNLISRQLMAAYFETCQSENPLCALVRPRTPLPRGRGLRRAAKILAKDLDDLSSLLSDLDGKDMPVLLRQYLKLGGVLLGFNLDPDFSYALDGLILVDLLRTEPRQLAKFMGKEAIKQFHAHHNSGSLGGKKEE